MTTVAGLISDGIVFLAGDEAGTSPGLQRNYSTNKVFKLPVVYYDSDGNKKDTSIGFGVAGCYRALQLMRYKLQLPPISVDVDVYINTILVDTIRKLFDENDYNRSDNGQKHHDGGFIIGLMGRLYNMECNYQVFEPKDPYTSDGSGSVYALAALEALKSYNLDPHEHLRYAVEVAIKYDPNTSGYVSIIEV